MEANNEGEKCPRKMREVTNQPSSSSAEPEQAKKEINLLPDIHNEILRKLWAGGEETLETLHSCRLVCREWEEFIDMLPPRLYWSPYIKNIDGQFNQPRDISECVSVPVTNLASDSHVNQFLMGLPQQDDSDAQPNPFQVGQTVKLCDITEQVNTEEKKVLMIIEKFGHHIKQLLYRPGRNVPKSLAALPQLMRTMTNLRTLIIDLVHLNPSAARKTTIRGEDFPELINLRELVVLREDEKEKETSYAKLAVKYGRQIRSLTVFLLFPDLDFNKSILMSKFPNLEDLKVEQAGLYGNAPAHQPLPKLKRLALGLPYCNELKVDCLHPLQFRAMLRLISCFSETLEVLSLDVEFNKKSKKDVRSEDDDLDDCNVITPLNRVTELVLPFWFMFRFPDDESTLETRLRFKFPQLQRLVLQDSRRDGYFSETERRRMCDTLWTRVPPTVETIAVRTEKWNGRLQRTFPVFLKCPRNPVN